ncbi:MAG: hypothetical protein JWO94_773 [Verrucomicrobiaceae bacterium]|nr:hypothetical protein [Verrucomicrobiaceae bacterium]
MKTATLRWKKPLLVAVGLEAFVVLGFCGFGSIGPCGPGNDWSLLVLWFHMPGLKLVELFSSDDSIASRLIFWTLIMAIGVLQWLGISLFVMWLLRRICGMSSNSSH